MIAYNAKLNGIASKFYGLYNFLIKQNWFKSALGIAKKRSLPKLHSKTLRQWFSKYKQDLYDRNVYLFCDEYTNYYDVELGVKSVKLLNVLGYKVEMIKHAESGRAYISKGFLNQAQQIAIKNVNTFKDIISDDTPLIGIEPSAILGFRDEYPNLVSPEDKPIALKLSKNVLLIDEFISREIEKGAITSSLFTSEAKDIVLHGHCHQKALSSLSYTEKILSLPLNYKVEVIPSGCCGMAGSFGYEKEHFELSNKIGEMVLFPAIRQINNTTLIAAPGTSCRHQIKDGTKKTAVHPVEILYDALK